MPAERGTPSGAEQANKQAQERGRDWVNDLWSALRLVLELPRKSAKRHTPETRVGNEQLPKERAVKDQQASKQTIALIFSPFGLLMIATLRLIIVSDYNPTTAATIASSGGYLSALFNSLIPLIPIFAPYLALLLFLIRRYVLSLLTFILAAFITPIPISPSIILRLVQANFQQAFGPIRNLYQPSVRLQVTSVILLLIIISVWFYRRSPAEAASVTAVIIVFSILFLMTPGSVGWLLIALMVIAIIYLVSVYYRVSPRLVSILMAIVATLALVPYILSIYPIPRSGVYYAMVLRQMWLPAEKIVLRSGHLYYGYVLSTDNDWYTVMQTNGRIIYVRANAVADRFVCEPTSHPPQYKPLITLLYSASSPIPACTSNGISVRGSDKPGQQ